ncbi:MAG TPA: phosphopantothenate--cysteine ligase, partial [Ruminococcaceae bacterium]|nr:phosphopantothenate--cysteine ligase [Oscillospiraceae bacterium]
MKKWQPSVILVGFKLLNHVEPQALLDAGYGVLKKNACDLVVA